MLPVKKGKVISGMITKRRDDCHRKPNPARGDAAVDSNYAKDNG